MTHVHVGVPQTEGVLIRRAAAYDVLVQALAIGRARRLRERMADIVGARPDEAVLDVGCGTGDLLLALARRVGPKGRAVGVDASPEMIARARRKARRARTQIELNVEAAEALSFPDDAFDRVVCSLVLHHLPGDLKRRAVAEMVRVLRPGGHVAVIDFLTPAEQVRGHRAAHTEGGTLPDWLRECGVGAAVGGALRVRWLGAVLGWPPLRYVQGRKAAASRGEN